MARITWTDKAIGEKAQFIADTFNECLFDYSFDSNKVPSLNLHFFCKDYIATYLLVKEASWYMIQGYTSLTFSGGW